jgi:putative phage-type endonuclease
MLPNRELNKKEWLNYRKENVVIGSSDISVIVGLNKYKSPLQLYHFFTSESFQDEQSENDYAWLGRQMESVILNLLKRQRPDLGAIANNESFADDWKVATPDGFTSDGGLLEIKYTRADYEIWQTGIPDYAHCQAIWQMGICGKSFGYVVAMLGGNADLCIHKVDFDPEIYAGMIEIAERFRESVKTKIPPAPNHLDSKLLDNLVKSRTGETELKDEDSLNNARYFFELQSRIKEVNAELKNLQELSDSLKNKLIAKLEDYETAHVGQFYISAKKVFRKGYTTKDVTYTNFKLKNKEE